MHGLLLHNLNTNEVMTVVTSYVKTDTSIGYLLYMTRACFCILLFIVSNVPA